MSDNNKDIYFSLNQNELNIAVFKKNDDKFIFFNKESLNIDTISENIDLETLKKPLGDNIIKIEKKLNSFVNNIFLMLESSSKLSVYISLMKKLDNKKIKQKDIIHIIQDAKQQIISAHPENYIAHIIVIKYVVNDVNYSSVPKNINCDTISIDIEFVCFPKNLINRASEILEELEHQNGSKITSLNKNKKNVSKNKNAKIDLIFKNIKLDQIRPIEALNLLYKIKNLIDEK